VRRALLSVVVGLTGAVVLAGAGWALQDVALAQPARADRVAADAAAWLRYYRLSIDVYHSDHHSIRGACLRGVYWTRRHGHWHRALASLSELAGGPVVLGTWKKHSTAHVSGRRRPGLPPLLTVAAGCTEAVANELDAAAQSGLRLRIERAYAANQPALALRLPRLRHVRLTVYLSPWDYRPLVVVAVGGGEVATARLYPAPATPARLEQFRRLLRRNPRFRA
jgi:hypothetical protein